jgi:hypothetical protein
MSKKIFVASTVIRLCLLSHRVETHVTDKSSCVCSIVGYVQVTFPWSISRRSKLSIISCCLTIVNQGLTLCVFQILDTNNPGSNSVVNIPSRVQLNGERNLGFMR